MINFVFAAKEAFGNFVHVTVFPETEIKCGNFSGAVAPVSKLIANATQSESNPETVAELDSVEGKFLS